MLTRQCARFLVEKKNIVTQAASSEEQDCMAPVNKMILNLAMDETLVG